MVMYTSGRVYLFLGHSGGERGPVNKATIVLFFLCVQASRQPSVPTVEETDAPETGSDGAQQLSETERQVC